MSENQIGLNFGTLDKIRKTFAEFNQIEKVILYGSRAKRNYRRGSDIDITLIGKDLILNNTIYPLMDKFEELYLPYTFDISIKVKRNKKLNGKQIDGRIWQQYPEPIKKQFELV